MNSGSVINKNLKKAKIDAAVDTKYTAEDWEGFQELVAKSNIQDKELILRVLSMYQDPEQREQEIKNISSVYKNLADEILPQLRYLREMTCQEVADALNVSRQTVHTHLKQSLEKIRKYFNSNSKAI